MNSNESNTQYMEDEISLKELILALWNRKIVIISLTLIFTLIAGFFSVFFMSPVYNVKLNIVISMPEKYQTRYGEYILPISTNNQYIQLLTSNDVLVRTLKDMNLSDTVTVESLRDRISINSSSKDIQTSNSFEIVVSANDPTDSLELAETLYKNYIEFIDVMTKERVVSYFNNNFTVELINLENSLRREEELLKANVDLLTQTEKKLTENSNLEILGQLGSNSNYVVPVDTINPNYIKIETDIITNKQTINSLSNTINMKKQYLTELDIEKQAIAKYYETGKTDKINLNLISIVETNVYMPSLPVAPTSKASPNTILNTAIGTVLGGMLGVFIALFQWYWYKE
jgi:capsular polysaccharide biosynthesis protein